MSENLGEAFNRLIWHDSKLRSLRIFRNANDQDEAHLDIELRGMPDQELTPMTVVVEDAIFFLSDLDLQGKRECADDISSATCEAKTDLTTKLQKDRLRYSPNALEGYFHFRFYLIPPGGTFDVVGSGFRLEPRRTRP
jgi:hypothetical protein